MLEQLLPLVDICSAGEMDALYLLGIAKAPETTVNPLIYYYEKMQERFPNIQTFYSTKRTVHSASENDLQGTLWMKDSYFESPLHQKSLRSLIVWVEEMRLLGDCFMEF